MNSDQSIATAKSDIKGKGPAKRSAKRNSEARKEQNRRASRNYREKRRQRLALLDEILRTEESSEQSLGEPSSSDGGGTVASGNAWGAHTANVLEGDVPTGEALEVTSDWATWFPPPNAPGPEPGMSLIDVMPGQEWSSNLGTVPDIGGSHPMEPDVFGALSTPPQNVSSVWQNAEAPCSELSTNINPVCYAAPESCAGLSAMSPEQAMCFIIKGLGNLTPSQKWALMNLLQQDAYNPNLQDSMSMPGQLRPT